MFHQTGLTTNCVVTFTNFIAILTYIYSGFLTIIGLYIVSNSFSSQNKKCLRNLEMSKTFFENTIRRDSNAESLLRMKKGQITQILYMTMDKTRENKGCL